MNLEMYIVLKAKLRVWQIHQFGNVCAIGKVWELEKKIMNLKIPKWKKIVSFCMKNGNRIIKNWTKTGQKLLQRF